VKVLNIGKLKLFNQENNSQNINKFKAFNFNDMQIDGPITHARSRLNDYKDAVPLEVSILKEEEEKDIFSFSLRGIFQLIHVQSVRLKIKT